jgi:hypothetical protein
MSTPTPPPTAAMPVIRQVALILLALCLLVPLALVWRAPRATQALHEPEQTRVAVAAVLAAVAAVGPGDQGSASNAGNAGNTGKTSDVSADGANSRSAQALAGLLPHCAPLPSRQGLTIFEDLAEQLALFDQQLAALTGQAGQRNAPLRQRHRLHTDAWAQTVPLTTQGCEQAVQALRLLAGPRGAALLSQARWAEQSPAGPGRAAGSAPAPAVQLAPNSLARVNPWSGWPGCIWLGGVQADGKAHHLSWGGLTQSHLCEQAGLLPTGATGVVAARPTRAARSGGVPARGDPAWSVPPHVDTLLSELDALRLPQGPLYGDYAAQRPRGHNRVSLGGNEVEVGFGVHLTIDPRIQTLAQQVAACYTGQPSACEQMGLAPDRLGAAQGVGAAGLWERAAARMTGVAVIDVASGRIEALASAHTRCYAQEHDGPFRDAACPALWTEPRRRPDALLNHAVFTDYLPGSTIKPLLASVFFEEPGAPQAALSGWLASSNTARFNDQLFCLGPAAGPGSNPDRPCDRPARVQQRAADLGWNSDCTTQPSPHCARSDLLFGRPLGARLGRDADPDLQALGWLDAAPLQRSVMNGRLFVSPAPGGDRLMPLADITPALASTCRDARGQWHAGNCDSSALKPLVNEAEGQGQARSTALGVASMVARLAAAANGLSTVRAAHLVERISDAQGQTVQTAATRGGPSGQGALARPQATVVKPEVANKVLAALAKGTQSGGTGQLICQHVFGARCAGVGPRLAGKTGTPSFSFDQLNLAQARQRCRAPARNDDCFERPIKFYVAAVKSGAAGADRYDKVIAVISERNWTQAGKGVSAAAADRIHGGDNDLNNVATEIAMRIVDAAWLRGGSGPAANDANGAKGVKPTNAANPAQATKP